MNTKCTLIAVAMALLAQPLVTDQLDSLQKLAQQLSQIRQETQAVQQDWRQTWQTLRLATEQNQRQATRTAAQRQLLQGKLAELRQDRKRLQNDSRSIRQAMARGQQALGKHLNQLLKDAKAFPPPLAKLVQRKAEQIRNLNGTPENLPRQLQLTQDLHGQIRQDAASLIRDSILMPHANAVFQAAFFGCSWAVAIAPDHSQAAFGYPTANGWDWQPATQYLHEIRAFFKILQDEQPARLVNLPMRLK